MRSREFRTIIPIVGNPSNAQVPTYDAIRGVYTPQDVGFSGITADDIIITDYTKGLVLTSPDGTRWRITVDASDLALDPGYTNNAIGTRDYSVGASMKAAGFPASTGAMAAGQLGCTSYVDIGAAQRQEPAIPGFII